MVTRDVTGLARTMHRGDHQIAFWISTPTGEMVIRGLHLDSDEDGLLDHWEINGLDVDQDGVIDLNLAALGADPNHRELFIEIDWLNDRNDALNPFHTHEPEAMMIQALVAMLASAPALPNGIPAGITPHIDAGPGLSVNMPAGALQGGDRIGVPGFPGAHVDMVYFGLQGSLNVPGVTTRSFQNVKNNFFGTSDQRAREFVFHYVVLADFHSFLPDNTTPCVGNVSAATSTSLIITGIPCVESLGDLAGHVVKITSGTGAGQLRAIMRNIPNILFLSSAWVTPPDTTSTFALLNGSSGLGEEFIRSPLAGFSDFNSYSGNDVLVTLGGFSIDQTGRLGNAFRQSQTLAHEVGHNLGLRHGGVDNQTSSIPGPNFKPDYTSLMNYAYQLCNPPPGFPNPPFVTNPPMSPCPVTTYSLNSDPVFVDWENLQLDFQSSVFHLGNSFLLSPGANPTPTPNPIVQEQEMTSHDEEMVNQMSSGTVLVIGLVGLDLATAQAALTTMGELRVGTITMVSDTVVPEGVVLSQMPAFGTRVALGTAVDLVVSSGSSSTVPGDLDGDGDIDQDDINTLLRDRNKSVNQSACGAPCDLDNDGKITALDARKLTLLCTRPRCATK